MQTSNEAFRSNPQVSVVIATRNGRTTLQRCLDGIAAQDIPRKEVIVVDSVSTDGTLDLLKRNAAEGKINRYVSEPDSGVYDAWNKGLALATGDWICFLGCDDVFHDAEALRSLVKAAAHDEGARVVYGRINRLTPSGQVVETIGQDWPQMRARFLAGTNIPHPGALHHRSLFEERGHFDATYRIAGDYDLLLRELPNRSPVFLDRVVVDMNLGGISSRPDSISKALHEVARARAANGLATIPLSLRLAAIMAWVIGVLHRLLGDRGFRLLADAYRIARGKPRRWTV